MMKPCANRTVAALRHWPPLPSPTKLPLMLTGPTPVQG